MEEEWKTIDNFPMYQVSNLGRVYTYRKNRFMSGCPNNKGYIQVQLCNETYSRGKLFSLNRIVYSKFGLYQEDFPNKEVDHIYRNKNDNSISNLRLLPHKQNSHNKSKQRLNKAQQECTSDFRGVYLDRKRNVWNTAYCKVHLGGFEHQVNAGYVWYHVAKHFREIMGDNEPILNAELPEEDEDRDEKVRKGIEKVKKKLDRQ
jgi:hypothetical protein